MSKAVDLYLKYRTLFRKNGFVTAKRLACFFGQAEAEVGADLKPKEEGGFYSTIEGLRKTFHTPFKGKSDDFIKKFVKLPKEEQHKLFNYVYAHRMGNGSETSGDGYKYRGKGIFQITGKNNYKMLSTDTGIDYVENPELLLTEADSLIGAIWYWNKNRLSILADQWIKGDEYSIDKISDLINIGVKTAKIGDSHGYQSRISATQRYYYEFLKLEKDGTLK